MNNGIPQLTFETFKLFCGVIFLIISVVILFNFFVALIFVADRMVILSLAVWFLVCLGLTFWLLDVIAIWREVSVQAIHDDAQNALKEAQEKTQYEQIVLEKEKIRHRQQAITAWRLPSKHLFDISGTPLSEQNRKKQTSQPQLRESMSASEAAALLEYFRQDLRFNWRFCLSYCEARADLMAEIATEHGLLVKKIWALPKNLDRDTIVSGWQGDINLPVNKAATEMVSWNFHVALLVNIDNGKESKVLDPTFFKEPVRQQVWCERMSYGKTAVRFEITQRFAYSDPFDDNGGNNRLLSVEARNGTLRECFNIENSTVLNGLEITLRAGYIDNLLQYNEKEFNRFIKNFEKDVFKKWWLHRPGFDRFEALMSNQYYFSLHTEVLREKIAKISYELQSFELKKCCWKQVGKALVALDAHPNKPLLDSKEFGAWFEPDSHALWASFGFKFNLG